MTDTVRPYAAAFAARFQLMLQYRAAALAGFATQCWWGGIKVMVYAAFFTGAAAANAPITLSQVITYTWLAQAFLVLSPWSGDPEISQAVRTGAIGYERFGLFALSMVLVVLVSSAFVMLLNISAVVTMDERGINTLVASLLIALSGNLLPLALYPDWMQTFLLVQPFASFLDIPFRIYFGGLTGWGAVAGLALQTFWTLVMIAIGRAWIVRVMAKLQMQGG